MDAQTAINILFSLVGILAGGLLTILWGAVRDLQQQDNELASKVQSIEVLVAGTYVKRDDMDRLGNAIFSKLDRIENKLDGKMDK